MKVTVCLLIALVSLWHGATCQEYQITSTLRGSTQITTRRFTSPIGEGGSLRVCVISGEGLDAPSTLIARTSDRSARVSNNDYTGLEETTLTFTESGQMQCIWVFAIIDGEVESTENFVLNITGETGRYRFDNINVEIIIRDFEFEVPSFSIARDNYPVSESDGSVEVCVGYYGSRPLGSSTTLELATLASPRSPVPGATENTDFTGMSENLTFPANSESGTLRCAEVKILPDNDDNEGEELFQMVLGSRSGDATISHFSSSTVRIVETPTLVAGGERSSTPPNSDGGNNNGNGGTDNENGEGQVVDQGGLNNDGVSSTRGASTILSLLFVALTVIVSTLLE